MKDELVAILYQAAKDVVENGLDEKKVRQLKYAIRVIETHKPRYAKPFVATFVNDTERGMKSYKTEFEADVAVTSYMMRNPSMGVTAAYYTDRRKIWEYPKTP